MAKKYERKKFSYVFKLFFKNFQSMTHTIDSQLYERGYCCGNNAAVEKMCKLFVESVNFS